MLLGVISPEKKQSDNEVLSVNRIKFEKQFSWKIIRNYSETIPTLFSQKLKLIISLDQWSKDFLKEIRSRSYFCVHYKS